MHLPDKLLSKMTIYQKLTFHELIRMLSGDEWKQLQENKKILIMQEIKNRYLSLFGIQKEISLSFPRGTNNSFSSCYNGFYDYDSKSIILDINLLSKQNGYIPFSILRHELEHVIQHYKVENLEKYPQDEPSIIVYDICLNNYKHPVSFCREESFANFHIKYDSQLLNSGLIYALAIPERSAYKLQKQMYPQKDTYFDSCYDAFNTEYRTCLSGEDIEILIDTCFKNLFYPYEPIGNYNERNLQATVMYDIQALALAEYDSKYASEYNLHTNISAGDFVFLSSNEDESLKTAHEKYLSKKREILAKYGYTIYGEYPVNNLYRYQGEYLSDIEKLSELTVEEQRVNPNLILYCVYNNDEALDYIKDTEAFILEAKKSLIYYPESLQEFLSEKFPEYFSKEEDYIL